ncbi:MAG TPA: YfhO family protein [Bryobacteraceae bacterium]|jgi:hypothetical protein|nr:YfhO family protein [Bryobacteraceae bacterium]
MRLRKVTVLSLVFTYLFFLDYLPPIRRVHLPYDLLGYHYPLADYLFQALRQGRFPEWDPTTYCGISFVGNVQAALFYPATWLVMAANIGRASVSYQSLQDLVFAHVWLAFLFCYLWLRQQKLTQLACVLGGGIFAFSGYLLMQLQHMGVVIAYAWMPFGLWGIEQAAQERRLRPLWKLAVASALCLLGGYPPTCFVFVVCALAYALGHGWRTAAGAVFAISASLALAAVQLMPAHEANVMKAFEPRYGIGIRRSGTFLSYLVPNYFGFGLNHPPNAHYAGEYLYLGVPAFLGLLWLVRCRCWRRILPALVMLAATLVVVTNPFAMVWNVIQHSELLAQICRDWYFLAGITLAAAPLAAIGLDHLIRQPRMPRPRWFVFLLIGLMAAWSVRQFAVWIPLGTDFPVGWKSLAGPAVTFVLFSAGLFTLSGTKGRLRTALMAALLFTIAIDYKVYGTSKWFDAEKGIPHYLFTSLPEMKYDVYSQIRVHPEGRIALDQVGISPLDLRHFGLTSPQGFDPFLPTQYQRLMSRIAHFRTNWDIDMDPNDEAALRLLGVRYFISAEGAPLYARLSANPAYRRLEPSDTIHKVFEFLRAEPPYHFDAAEGASALHASHWTPEHREFVVSSAAGGSLLLAEQFFPGWKAEVDGSPAPILRMHDAFQSVRVPPGEHRVSFRFRSAGLRIGALLSLLSLGALALYLRLTR